MSFTLALKKILQPGRQGTVTDGKAHLKETEKGAVLTDAYIINLSTSDFFYNADKIKGIDNLVRSPHGSRHCDYVIFTTFKEQPRAVFVEMKSRSFRQDSYTEQLKGAEAMCHFLSRIGTSFGLTEATFSDFTPHYVVLHKLSMSKNLSILSTPTNKTPETALELYVDDSNTLSIAELIID